MAKDLTQIAQTLQVAGRSAGFMQLRDLLLTNAAELKTEGISLQGLVKMVLEVDRHAMAAEMMSLKTAKGDTPPEWMDYQKYLRGDMSLEEYLSTKPGVKAPVVPDETPTEEQANGNEKRARKAKRF